MRVIDADIDKTLRQQLQPGDEVVQFVMSVRREPALPPSDALLQAVLLSTEVLVVELTDLEAELFRSSTWIRTRFRARIVSVFKGDSTTREGDERQFTIGGGRMQIDGVTVQVQKPLPYAKGQRYLAFLGRKDPGSGADADLHTIGGAMPLLQRGDAFLAYSGFSEELNGITTNDLRNALDAQR